LSWYEAFAFCIWDGGRLPTEAEWEYAAAGGDENRIFPWGGAVPGLDANLAVWGCHYQPTGSCYIGNIAPVGSVPAGDGRWGHADLAGSIWEWNLDYWYQLWYTDAAATGTDIANLAIIADTSRVMRGGAWQGPNYLLRAAARHADLPYSTNIMHGVRCARSAAP
jgi:formylglycine-generating enzyme required for sulfatase activity